MITPVFNIDNRIASAAGCGCDCNYEYGCSDVWKCACDVNRP